MNLKIRLQPDKSDQCYIVTDGTLFMNTTPVQIILHKLRHASRNKSERQDKEDVQALGITITCRIIKSLIHKFPRQFNKFSVIRACYPWPEFFSWLIKSSNKISTWNILWGGSNKSCHFFFLTKKNPAKFSFIYLHYLPISLLLLLLQLLLMILMIIVIIIITIIFQFYYSPFFFILFFL